MIAGGLDATSQSVSYSGFGSSASGNGGNVTISSTSGDVTLTSDLTTVLTTISQSISGSAAGISSSGNGGDVAITSMSGDIAIDGILETYSSLTGSGISGDGGDVVLSSDLGDIQIANPTPPHQNPSPLINSLSVSLAGDAGNGGNIFFGAPAGSVMGDGQIVTIAITETAGTTGAGGDVNLAAASRISGFTILSVAGSGDSGDVDIQGSGDRLTLADLGLTISGQLEISVVKDVFASGENLTFNPDAENLGQSGDTQIRATGDIILTNVNIEAGANGNQPAGDFTIKSPSLIAKSTATPTTPATRAKFASMLGA